MEGAPEIKAKESSMIVITQQLVSMGDFKRILYTMTPLDKVETNCFFSHACPVATAIIGHYVDPSRQEIK